MEADERTMLGQKQVDSKPCLQIELCVPDVQKKQSQLACIRSDNRSHLQYALPSHREEESFICIFCGKCIIGLSNFSEHEQTHKGENVFACTSCGKTFVNQSGLIVHQQLHLQEKNIDSENKVTANTEKASQKCRKCGKFIQQSSFEKLWPYVKGSCLKCADCETSLPTEVGRPQLNHNLSYKCANCGQSFPDHLVFVSHQMTHREEKSFICSNCGKDFAGEESLSGHLLVCAAEESFRRTNYWKSFRYGHSLSHKQSQTNKKTFHCVECGKSFFYAQSLSYHKLLHIGEKPFKCATCGKSFVSRSTLKKHQKRHIRLPAEQESYTCTDCGRCFPKRAALVSHQRAHKLYECSDCGKGFTEQASYIDHRLSHTVENSSKSSDTEDRKQNINLEKSFSCTICGMRFFKRISLFLHQRSHSSSFKCVICGQSFVDQLVFIKHQLTHPTSAKTLEKLSSMGITVKSTNCGKSLADPENPSENVLDHRSEELPFQCKDCGKSFLYKKSIYYHHLLHTGQKTFHCPDCDKSFIKHSSLVKHQETHKKPSLHTCSNCGKCFLKLSSLLSHRRVHNVSFECSDCGEVFRDQLVFIKHKLTHTGKTMANNRSAFLSEPGKHTESEMNNAGDNKPYKCSKCEKSFTHQGNLVKHQFTHN
ncbi:oocyte zinc finger protein XlCOF6-like [Protopterus annectens]|uniref:oocyte zinc finger protein XlCOF6-like n=1 Tax=Protopterus annectens TaxID=7888 RepID=UPI001CFAE4D7|nr:oocyte zinc finger protein XlCOF6-like [Protopterus annectens]XP_043931829.1 oocyte zinc finger protein XlCOF6-like [Protopterus annectens]